MIESTKNISGRDSAAITTIICDDSLDISVAGRLHEVLAEAIHDGHPVHLDFSQITRIDAACIQLLYSFLKAAYSYHIDINWSAHNHLLTDALRLAGLSDHIMIPASYDAAD